MNVSIRSACDGPTAPSRGDGGALEAVRNAVLCMSSSGKEGPPGHFVPGTTWRSAFRRYRAPSPQVTGASRCRATPKQWRGHPFQPGTPVYGRPVGCGVLGGRGRDGRYTVLPLTGRAPFSVISRGLRSPPAVTALPRGRGRRIILLVPMRTTGALWKDRGCDGDIFFMRPPG